MLNDYPLPDNASADTLNWGDFGRYEKNPEPGTEVEGYRIMRRHEGKLYPAFTKVFDVTEPHPVGEPIHSLTEAGFNYWSDLNVAIQYANKLATKVPPVNGDTYDIHKVRGVALGRNPYHREGDVMEHMIIESDEPIARFYNDK